MGLIYNWLFNYDDQKLWAIYVEDQEFTLNFKIYEHSLKKLQNFGCYFWILRAFKDGCLEGGNFEF